MSIILIISNTTQSSQGPTKGGGGTGVLPRWLRDSPQYKQCYRGLVSGEAILSAENSAKPLGGRGSAPNPAGGPLGAPSDPVAGGRGLAAPPQELHPLSRRSALRSSPPKTNPGHVLE